MGDPVLTATRSVLQRKHGVASFRARGPFGPNGEQYPVDDIIVFGWEVEPADTTERTVMIDRATWEDLGSPDEITVTIEPGDRLNED